MKRDTIIKVLSLSLGLTIGIILIAKIFYEISYDTAYQDSERIYKIMTNVDRGEGDEEFGQISGGVAPGFKSEIPGVEAATRLTGYSDGVFKDEEKNTYNVSTFAVDSCFFDVFSRDILIGNPKEILSDPSLVMVSEDFAYKLGGTEKALGKKLYNSYWPDTEFIVSGVYENFKPNGSINPDMVASLNLINEWSRLNWLGNDRYFGYVKLMPGIEPESLTDAIHSMQENHQQLEAFDKAGIKVWYTLSNLSSLHRGQSKIKSAIIILSIMAFLIICVSLFNYILVVISGIVKKSKDIGVRKCYGATTKSIYLMLAKESVWLIVLSLMIAGSLIFIGKGIIKETTGYEFSELWVPQSIIAISIVICLVLIISIILPTGVYLRIPVGKAIRGYNENSRRWKIGLLCSQIIINIFIICFVLIVTLQYDKVNNFNPGYKVDNILMVDYFNDDPTVYTRIINELKSDPDVQDIGICVNPPYRGVPSGNDVWPMDANDDERFNIADMMAVTPETFDIFDLYFVEGGKPENPNEVAVSRSFVEKMNNYRDWKDGAVGKQFRMSGHASPVFTISGVVEDIIVGNLLEYDNRPVVWPYGSLEEDKDYLRYIIIRVNEINPEVLSHISRIIKETTGEEEIDVEVLKANLSHAYDESRNLRTVLLIGGAFSLLIALMGLVGFLNDESQRRRKELAIRKINGASSKDLFSLFYSSIIKLSLVSAMVACCGAFIMGRHWLQQFSEKITLSPLIFICGTLFILIIVTGVVMINSYKVITANPIKSLYNE